jgi:hypothetical protein
VNLQKGQPLAKFTEILAFTTPESQDEDLRMEILASKQTVGESDEQPPDSDDEQPEGRGLHAKLVLATHNQGHTLWLGSANATSAAWSGKNAEVMARLTVTDQAIIDGLLEFMGMVQIFTRADLPEYIDDDPDVYRLEEARRQVVIRWQVKQRRHRDGPQLFSDSPPHPGTPDIILAVGLLTGDLVEWPRGKLSLQLPPVPKALETELVQVQLKLNHQLCTWIQMAPLTPPPDEERDHQALARYLDPRTFLLWLRALLKVADLGDGGGDWDKPATPSNKQKGAVKFNWWAPTLEEILKAWSLNPVILATIQRRVDRYLTVVKNSSGEYDRDEQKILQEFENVWSLVQQTLLEA